VAQKALEYLGVAHDTPLVAQPELAKRHADSEIDEDAPSDHTGDLDALFAEVNNLPADDPLRGKGNGQQPVPSAASELTSGAEQAQVAPPAAEKTPRKTIAENADPTAASSPPAPKVPVHAVEAKKETPPLEPSVVAREPHVSGHGVVVAANRVGVPSFLGEPLRVAIESASTAGLALQIVGSGIAREQVPAPGSMVPAGTEIVVRFTR
jgi:cell division protein FtsI (penicillin-binding protein 3)